jgi:hypothetical protein
VVSEAAIAALEAAEAPADDFCGVCLQDGAAPAAWSRVAQCGHRFHAACAGARPLPLLLPRCQE